MAKLSAYQAILEKFFADYAKRFNDSLAEPPVINPETTAAAFAESFIEANPHGVNAGKNDAEFLKAIPQGFAYYKSIGTKLMAIQKLTITDFDEFHSSVKVDWHSEYQKPSGEQISINFSVTYLLQILNQTPKIFAYITGDEQKVLQDNSLIPKS
jgi:hypothetical protein